MPFIINNEIPMEEIEIKSIRGKIRESADRYIKYTDSMDVNLILLKSFIYTEELLGDINKRLHGIDPDRTTLGTNIKLFSLIKDDATSLSIKLLKNILKTRNKIAHNLEYDVLKDITFIKIIKKYYIENNADDGIIDVSALLDETGGLDIPCYQHLISTYFSGLINGILYVKSGLETMPNFIAYTTEE